MTEDGDTVFENGGMDVRGARQDDWSDWRMEVGELRKGTPNVNFTFP